MAGFAGLDLFDGLAIPDLWQQEAVRQLKAGCDVILDAPTGAGKTFVFESLIESRSVRGQSIYTVPTRALANDKRAEWQRRGWTVGIATGDLSELTDAPVVVATLETQRERLLNGKGPALLVIDEYQMMADEVRGPAYELVIALAPRETQLLLISGSVANTGEVAAWLQRNGRNAVVVSTADRPVPLDEMPIESLPAQAPAHIQGFWPRVAVAALMADLGPLLIFAPRRSQAEKIARKIAEALPADDPLALTVRQREGCGRTLSAVLEKRVAWHHSGLGYPARAGVVEPLAKAGKLRVVVATMGLAAGINFSLRSVLVSETRYFDGRLEREVAPDELLQMFGRAGRRGLDRTGYVIVTPTSPRLADAAPLRLPRRSGCDWPVLLRVMDAAARRDDPPFAAAEAVGRSLFAADAIDLGIEAGGGPGANPSASGTLFGLGPTRREVSNSRGEWEPLDATSLAVVPLGEANVIHHQVVEPALENYHFVANHFRIGRVCRIDVGGRRLFGREVALGLQAEGRRMFVLTRAVREWINETRETIFNDTQLEESVIPRLAAHFEGGRVVGLVQRGEILAVRLDFSRHESEVYIDRHGVRLIDPETREVPVATDGAVVDRSRGAALRARPGSAVALWRQLGLIDSDGTPTRRGVITSFFQRGEGMAVAAGLEEGTLPMDELLPLLANLRAGQRFSDATEGNADRLAAACRNAFGMIDCDGYLVLGLPVGYGEGASEAVAAVAAGSGARRRLVSETIGEGDLERTFIEWLSLLRHITHAPDFAWSRWMEMKSAAAAELARHAHRSPYRTPPEVPLAQLRHRVDHLLSRAKLRA